MHFSRPFPAFTVWLYPKHIESHELPCSTSPSLHYCTPTHCIWPPSKPANFKYHFFFNLSGILIRNKRYFISLQFTNSWCHKVPVWDKCNSFGRNKYMNIFVTITIERMNIWIYSPREIDHKWLSKQLHLRKNQQWIWRMNVFAKYIWIYSNIRIFVAHWFTQFWPFSPFLVIVDHIEPYWAILEHLKPFWTIFEIILKLEYVCHHR